MNVVLNKCGEEIQNSDLKVILNFEGELLKDNSLNENQVNLLNKLVTEDEKFTSKFGKIYYLPYFEGNKKYLIAGLGKKEEFETSKIREISSKIIQKISKIKSIKNPKMCLCKFDDNACEIIKAAVEGLLIGNYSFDKYKSENDKNEVENFYLCTNKYDEVQDAYNKGKLIAESLNFARDLINEPAQVVNPQKLAEVAQSLNGVETRVYNKQEIQDMKMGAFLAVGQGSVNEPKFIHIKYTPANPTKKIAIIGKSITFDSGGLDIKPAASMLSMKEDMSGSACVLGIMNVISKLGLNIEVHGIIASCENMPSGSSYKPGDVVIARNGKTIEVDNTDAEGRLTLADALCYADELGVDEIIDIATLTGACMVALGSCCSGIMGTNQKMIDDLIKAGKDGGEKLWQLPLFEEYNETLKSDIADMRNAGGRYAGASTAGCFLGKFVKNPNWAHIDIAGTAFATSPSKELQKGAAGAGVRTILNYILSK